MECCSSGGRAPSFFLRLLRRLPRDFFLYAAGHRSREEVQRQLCVALPVVRRPLVLNGSRAREPDLLLPLN